MNQPNQAELQGALHEAIAEEQYQSIRIADNERDYRKAINETTRLTSLLHGDIEKEGDQRPATDKTGTPKCRFIEAGGYVFRASVTDEVLRERVMEQLIDFMRNHGPLNDPSLLGRGGLLAPLKKALTLASKGEVGEALAILYIWCQSEYAFDKDTDDWVGTVYKLFNRDMGVQVLEVSPEYQATNDAMDALSERLNG